jgi:hypothetical protein
METISIPGSPSRSKRCAPCPPHMQSSACARSRRPSRVGTAGLPARDSSLGRPRGGGGAHWRDTAWCALRICARALSHPADALIWRRGRGGPAGFVQTLPNEGMPRHNYPMELGNLYVEYAIVLPSTLTEAQKQGTVPRVWHAMGSTPPHPPGLWMAVQDCMPCSPSTYKHAPHVSARGALQKRSRRVNTL